MLTDWLEIDDGKWRPVDFAGHIIISDGFAPAAVLAKVNTTLSALMNIELHEMGELLRISDVYAAIDNIEGVLFVELTSPVQTITPEHNELLILGDVDFSIRLKGSAHYGQNF